MRSSFYFKTISRILILAMLHLCWLTSYGYAEIVPTESANQSQYQDDRQQPAKSGHSTVVQLSGSGQ
jgi:hypothetical protein